MRKYLVVILCLIGCGRYEPALPPEAISPRAIQELKVLTDLDGVTFEWEAPETDLLGDELKSIDGYFVFRKALLKKGDLVDPDVEYELIATIPDTHLIERDRLRKEAVEKGLPSRRINADGELAKFTYSDRTLSPGAEHIYKIVPYNQDDVEGEALQIVRILFRGQNSEVTFLTQESLRKELYQPEAESETL